MTTTISSAQDARREALVNGLHSLADFLAANPDAPTHGSGEVHYSVFADSDQAGLARLAEIAAAIGVEITDNGCGRPGADTTHFYARRRFGPVTYEASYITEAHMADYQAHMSYRDSVRADRAEVSA
ncbi:hypothetical protein [Actinoplanes sp. NPDC026619]|uniref:hypothetical protein n=1 Tax=Actinoplanes sp. NPDC026619 TaxID=3155798 RepID=UPI0033D72DF8